MRFTLQFIAGIAATVLSSTAVSADLCARGSPRNHVAGCKRAAPAHWTYGQDSAGPQHWGTLDPLYGTCGTGHRQSPIDIEVGAPYVHLQNKVMKGRYEPIRNALCGYDGHAVKCEWKSQDSASNSIVLKGKQYNLASFHFHTPSEHRIDNHFADAELHLVHVSPEDNSLAVVGIMLEIQAKANPFFNWITALDKKADRERAGHGFLIRDKITGEPVKGEEQVKYKVNKIDFSSLLKTTHTFTPRWEYEGSLTTPPCSEGVAWNVVKTSVGLGIDQFDALVNLEAFNSRFIQDRPTSSDH